MHRGGTSSLRDIDWTERRWNSSQAYSDRKLFLTALAFVGPKPLVSALSEILNHDNVAAGVVLLRIREPPSVRRYCHTVGDLPWRRAE
jgi:hypothetical protein